MRLELKRALKRLPYVYAGAVMLLLLTGTIAFLAARMLYGGETVGRIRVGVSLPEGDDVGGQVVRMLSGFDSVSSVCDFTYMDMDQCLRELEDGELFAAIEVPEGFVQDIISGRNTPVAVWLPKTTALEGRLFAALADAGALTLSAAQAGIYAGNEMYAEAGTPEKVSQMERDLNRYYLNFSLPRLGYFRRSQVSGTGDVGTMEFYMISAFVLFLFLAAVPAGDYLLPFPSAMRLKLDTAGLGGAKRVLCRILGLAMLLLAAAAPVAAVALWSKVAAPSWLLPVCLLLACVAVSALVVFFYDLAGTLLGGLMLLFLTTAAQHFMAGGFLPKIFLPPSVRTISGWLPSGILMDTLKMAFLGKADGGVFAAVCGLILCGTALAVLTERRRP